MAVTAHDIAAAPPRGGATRAAHARGLSSRTISERTGGNVALKAENLQRTGSFKVRGASAKLEALGEEGCADGVVAASAGNHAQALAAAARAARRACDVFVPADAPIAKAEAARGHGAHVHVGGESLDECIALAREHAEDGGPPSCIPTTTRTSWPGQGSLGLELLEDVPDLARVVVPRGRRRAAAGIAIAVKSARPEVEVIGVQVAACAPYPGVAARAASRCPRRPR